MLSATGQILLLALAAIVATVMPARRATRADPMWALPGESLQPRRVGEPCNNSAAAAYILQTRGFGTVGVPGTDWDVIDFSELYRTYAGDVHRFALFLSGDPALADDILSETFIRLWHARNRVDLTTVKGYLLAIARNLFLAERRHSLRTTPLDERAQDTQAGPERRAHAHIELQAVLAALQRLPEIDRAAVLLRAEEGMSYEEVGAALGISAVAARVKVHRARLKLAEARRGGAPAIVEPEV